jgi:signal transduction histidine kinase
LSTATSASRSCRTGAAQIRRIAGVGQLTGGIAHDFNNLLAIITSNRAGAELADPEQKDLLAARNNAARWARGSPATARSPAAGARPSCSLNEQVLTMAELLRRALGETIVLGTLLAPGLWSVRADPSEIENAVLNLAINARDAMPGGGKLVIETKNVMLDDRDVATEVGVQPGDYVRLSVSDTGVGMTREVLARVFEPFFTTKEPGKGTGLGLSVIYGFEAIGRTRHDLQREGKGTVSLYLPRTTATAGAERSSRGRLPPPQEIILLVDHARYRRQPAASTTCYPGHRGGQPPRPSSGSAPAGASLIQRGDAGRNVGLRSRARCASTAMVPSC